MAVKTKAPAAKKPKKHSPSKRRKSASRKTSGRGSEDGQNGYLDVRITKALSHWIRVNILAVASWRVISPSEFARETGIPLKKASYHFRRLVAYDALELVETKVVGSTVKRLYRGTRQALFAGANWEQLPKSVQDGVAGAALQDFSRVATRSFESGKFSARDDSHLTWDPVVYDELAFKAMVKILARTREQLLALEKEARPRLQKTGQEGVLVAFALAGFEMPKPELE